MTSSPTIPSSSNKSEMRFDPASSRYALFGAFYVGIRFAPTALGEVLRAGVPMR